MRGKSFSQHDNGRISRQPHPELLAGLALHISDQHYGLTILQGVQHRRRRGGSGATPVMVRSNAGALLLSQSGGSPTHQQLHEVFPAQVTHVGNYGCRARSGQSSPVSPSGAERR
ncbi:hypothetical protein [Streptomyces sp. NPDC059786]|uniref:hypothetical protein n=1 Tax=Streptomyces sp. NPDC059786 TaxID=3346946 RepID=UPI00364EE301